MDTCTGINKLTRIKTLLPISLVINTTKSDCHETNKNQDLNILAPEHNLFLVYNLTSSLANHLIQKITKHGLQH